MRGLSKWLCRGVYLATAIAALCWLTSFWWSFGVGASWNRADQQYFQMGVDAVDGQFQFEVTPFHYPLFGVGGDEGGAFHSRVERTIRVENPNPFLPHRRDGLFRAGQVRGTSGPTQYLVFFDGLVLVPALIVLSVGSFLVRRNADGRCRCAYSLSGLTTNTCPECGRAIRKPADA